MAQDAFNVSAPGSLMLFGEHAVLRGKPAIAAAVNQRMTITVTPRNDRKVRIRSSLGNYDEHIDEIEPIPPFTFMLTAIQNDPVFTGATFEVHSEFSSTVGLGSSAAVTTATVAALRQLRGLPFALKEIFSEAVLEVRQAQGGRGSGTDVAASTYGGLIYYKVDPYEIEPIKIDPPKLSLVYSGYKVPTPAVIEQVETLLKSTPQKGQQIFEDMETITLQARKAFADGDWEQAGGCMNDYYACQQALGVSNEDLDVITSILREAKGITGAKISGAGLGDCVVGLGSASAEVEKFEKIPIAVGKEGVQIDTT